MGPWDHNGKRVRLDPVILLNRKLEYFIIRILCWHYYIIRILYYTLEYYVDISLIHIFIALVAFDCSPRTQEAETGESIPTSRLALAV